jgi:hypothetical protein
MKRGLLVSAIVVLITITTGFAYGQAVEKETRNLSGFTRVSFGISGDLFINFGSDFKVVLEGNKSLLDKIETEISGGKLIIKKDSWHSSVSEKVTVYITMPELEGLGVSGSGKAEIKDAVKASDLDLSVSGSGKIVTADINVKELNVSISGSGDVIIEGSGDAAKADVAISGSGNYTGENLKIGSADFSISGSGSCRCNVTDNLSASVSGSGNVTYIGSPKIDARVSGSGRVRSK